MKTTIPPVLITFALVCFALVQNTRAVSPTPDGGYPGANTAEGGSGALFSLTTGTNDTALGAQALFSVTTGSQNTATGAQALKNNTANNNTADGFQALVNNTTGHDNTATGWRALFQNTTGFSNTAIGSGALYLHVTNGGENTAVGFQALYDSGGANGNTSIGSRALHHNGNDLNTAVGLQALFNNNAGAGNIALGAIAGFNITDGSANIDIGNQGVVGDSNTIRIGTISGSFSQTATFIAGIWGVTASGGTPVYINSDGQLGIATSSARFKQNIQNMDNASEALFALKPVAFRYKKQIDPAGTPQLGLVAEDVEKVNPDLVVRDKEGKPYTVRYDQINAMLLNEFLKEHGTVQELKSTVTNQQAMIGRLESTVAKQEKGLQTVTARLEEQAAQIQKVSAQLEASKPAPQVVNNP